MSPSCNSLKTRPAVNWAVSDGPVGYDIALDIMSQRVTAIRDAGAPELAWSLEHPPLYTAGTGAKPKDLLIPDLLPIYATGRGGQYTYHGPGQRVVYLMFDMKQRSYDVRGLVHDIERWIIAALDRFNVKGERRDGRVGIWVRRPTKHGIREEKIAAIGLRVSRWVTSHGISLNVDPTLSHYRGIVPCGLADYGVTSLTDLGLPITMADADVALRLCFQQIFGPITFSEAPCSSDMERRNIPVRGRQQGTLH